MFPVAFVNLGFPHHFWRSHRRDYINTNIFCGKLIVCLVKSPSPIAKSSIYFYEPFSKAVLDEQFGYDSWLNNETSVVVFVGV